MNSQRLPLFSLACLLIGAFSGPFAVSREDAGRATANQLVQKLGSDLFAEREQASQDLEKLGVSAREALEVGLTSPDPEIVRRCRLLLPLIENQELEILVKNLSSGTLDPEKLNLPGWARYKEQFGSAPDAQKFFLEMVRSELVLIRDVERRPENGWELILGRCQTFNRNPVVVTGRPGGSGGPVPQISEAELGGVLFCALNPKVKVQTSGLHHVNSLLYNTGVRNQIQNAKDGSPFRLMLGKWLELPTDANGLLNNLYVAKNINLKEGADLAARMLRDNLAKKAILNPYQKGLACCVIGKMGNKSHLKLLTSYFQDENVIQTFAGVNGLAPQITQVNDVALAMAIHLTSQDHKKYGFHFATQGRSLNFEPSGLGFNSQEKRQNALKQWEDWAKLNAKEGQAEAKKPG